MVPLPPDLRALGTRWVLTIKGQNMPKVCLVAQGHRQIEGIEYTENLAPVARYDSVRVFLALSACLQLTIQQMDVKSLSGNNILRNSLYMEIGKSFNNHMPESKAKRMKHCVTFKVIQLAFFS